MFPVLIDYATPSSFESDRDRQQLGLVPNQRRPVRFHAQVAEQVFPFRLMLQALGEVVWSDDSWIAEEDFRAAILDPVITVHPDRIFLEAFSQDQSAYAVVIADRSFFDSEGEVSTGTTNVDFTGWLWSALGEMRSSRETWFRVEPAGFEVQTTSAGGRFEAKVDLPDSWVRGFLQLQGAMAMPGTRLRMRPVDLLAAIRYLRETKARVSPRALRYEFPPNQPARIVLEPFEQAFELKETEHGYDELRIVRTWGRRRLQLLESLLPYADEVEVFLKGRALPSFYAVKLAHLTFVLGLSGWTAQRWTGRGRFDLLVSNRDVDDTLVEQVLDLLRARFTLHEQTVVDQLGASRSAASRSLAALCRRGLAIYDVQQRNYRNRELFETPVDETKLYPPDPRNDAADMIVAQDKAIVDRCDIRETRKRRKLKTPAGKVERVTVYKDWEIEGRVDRHSTEIVVNDMGRIIFGKCQCDFFSENLMNQGPCEHMLALFQVSGRERGE
jgi:hypothetical protein